MKSNEKSETLRNEGNKLYSERKFFEALLKYNESLCYAEADSENLGFAYANKSAVFFEMKLYERCIANINAARKNRYPEKNFEVLKNRENKCNQLMQQQEKFPNPWNFFKLSYPANKKHPTVVNCLQVESSQKFGRFVTTNRDLKVGDILSIEQPYCSILLSESKFVEIPKSNIYQRCSNCLKDNSMDLLPCETCCHGERDFTISLVEF